MVIGSCASNRVAFVFQIDYLELAHDEQHAFRYEVRDQRGTTIGFINTDRARQHPNVKWERSLLRNGGIEKLVACCRKAAPFAMGQVINGLR